MADEPPTTSANPGAHTDVNPGASQGNSQSEGSDHSPGSGTRDSSVVGNIAAASTTPVEDVVKFVQGVAQTGSAASKGNPLGEIAGVWRKASPRRQRERFEVRDWLTRYEWGLELLEERIPPNHPQFVEIASQRNRLTEVIEHIRLVGTSQDLHSQLNEVISGLNRLTMTVIGIVFSDLCREHQPPATLASGQTILPPTTFEEASNWYMNLGPMQQCFVIAVSVLYGAPSHEISRAAKELHHLVEQEVRQRLEKVGKDGTDHHESTGVLSPSYIAAASLLQDTFTVAEKREGAERVFWRDEQLAPLVLNFIARQATVVGISFDGRNLLDILQDWALTENVERGWRAARALAEIWWRQDQDHVLELAQEWAKSDSIQTWQSGAALLYGAFDAERAEMSSGIQAARSAVLARLQRWSDFEEDGELACVAAYTYGLLGHRWPTIALDGLDSLLHLSRRTAGDHSTELPFEIVVFAMLSFLEVAGTGNIRAVLSRLASHAMRLAHQPTSRPGSLESDRLIPNRAEHLTFVSIRRCVATSGSG